MKEHIDNALKILKEQDVEGCITGSCLLDYFEGQDVDVFMYNESSFNQLLFFMHYNPMFQILDPLELHKFNNYIKNNDSSLKNLGLITIKFKYNLLVDINVIFKKFNKNLFDVISNFDLDIIATGYDIKTGKTLSLRETTGMTGTWNKWNNSFYKEGDFWSVKRLLRQFERVIKYTQRGYDLTSVTDKYLEIVENVIKLENFYKSTKGVAFFEANIKQFEIVFEILKDWKKHQTMTNDQLLVLKTLI